MECKKSITDLRVVDSMLQYSTDCGCTWTTLGAIGGEDGKDGVSTAPMLKIVDGYWMISYDSSETWNPLRDSNGNPISCSGKDGANVEYAIFSVTITVDALGQKYAVFVLRNGQEVKVPIQ